MTIPAWNDPKKGGTMVRTALWLVSEVGVGNSFTKEQHRSAFAGIAQADRRLRDLRRYGWVINTNLEDLSLNSNEQRLVKVGIHVWEKNARRKAADSGISAKKRRAVFAENNYQCISCGIAAGESYPEEPLITAVLSISRLAVQQPDGSVAKALVTECNRCRAGGGREAVDLQSIKVRAAALSAADRVVMAGWMENGRSSELERIWADVRRLPADLRRILRESLKGEG